MTNTIHPVREWLSERISFECGCSATHTEATRKSHRSCDNCRGRITSYEFYALTKKEAS